MPREGAMCQVSSENVSRTSREDLDVQEFSENGGVSKTETSLFCLVVTYDLSRSSHSRDPTEGEVS